MLYLPRSREDTAALIKAVARGKLRRVAQGIYSDDFEASTEDTVLAHFLAIVGALYPEAHLSHSTAALLRPLEGVAYISTPTRNPNASTRLPGVRLKRHGVLPYPEIVTLQLNEEIKNSLSSDPRPASVRISSPLQAIFEVLQVDAREPERTIPLPQIVALVEALPADDVKRAWAFAERNGLHRELARFDKILGTISDARTITIPRPETVEIYFYHFRVGSLERLAHGEIRFNYEPNWRVELSGLPLDRRPAFESRGLPPFFDNLLPEGWAEARMRAVYKIPREDEFALLTTTSKYLSNFTVRGSNFPAEQLVLDVLDFSLDDVAGTTSRISIVERINEDPEQSEFWQELRRRGATRLSGVQAKLPVHIELAGDSLTVDLGHLRNTSTHILKLPSPIYPQLIENEWATMELARKCGLQAAAVRLVDFQSGSPLAGPGLLVERFDIPSRSDLRPDFLIIEEAASIMGLTRAQKYSSSIERVAAALFDAGINGTSLDALFRHVLYSWLVGNGDLHEKNFAVLHVIGVTETGLPPRLNATVYSPLYDLVNTRIAIRDDDFALPLNGKKNRLRRKDFHALSSRWGWTRTQTYDAIDSLVAALKSNLDQTVSSSGLSERSIEAYRQVVTDNIANL